MKKTLLSIMMLVVGAFASNAQAPYCTPLTTSGCSVGDQILNFSTTGGTTNISNLNSGCSTGNYEYVAQAVTILPGGTFNFAVQSGPTWSQGQRIWVDWNNDYIYDNTTESMWTSPTWSTAVQTGSITAPPGAVGTFRMRVRCSYNSLPTDPCANQSYGEVEEYDVVVLSPYANDAGLANIESPVVPTCSLGNSSITVELQNAGYDTLNTCNINYSINGGPVNTYNWSGSLAPYTTLTGVTIGSATFSNGDNLAIWTDSPNGFADSLPSNDMLNMTVSSGLAGVYTIGATGTYPNFNAAVSDLNAFGLCDDVIFDVQDGVYNEQITLGPVVNANDTNTITFRGMNQNPTTAVITFNGTGTANNWVVKLDAAEHFIFQDLGIANMGVTYGTAVLVQGGSHKNIFTGNILMSDTTSTSTSTFRSVVYSPSGSLDTLNTFDGNDIIGGSYGAYWYGVNTTSMENGNVWSNNNFSNFYYRGLMSYYQINNEITGNTFTPRVAYTGYLYRLYCYYNFSTTIAGNRILGDQIGYGMYLSSCNGNLAAPSNVYNNFIHVGSPVSTSSSYGVYMASCNYMNYIYNSTNLESNGTAARALYVSGGNNNKAMYNSFATIGPGYGIYILSGINDCDYNNVYTPTGNYGYSSTVIPDINTWQTNTGFGMYSDTLDPQYISNIDLHTCADQLDGAALPDSIVMYDIDGQMRDANTPDIGADEFLGLANLSFGADTLWKCSSDSITLGGWTPTNDATYQWSNLATTPSITVFNPGNYFVNVTSTTGCGTASPSVQVENIPDAVAGFSVGSSFMTFVPTNTSSGTITSYYWDFGDGTYSTEYEPLHLYADTGYYVVTLTVTGPCGTDVYTDTMYSNTVGLDEYSINNALEVYPNPNKGEFTINLSLDQAAEVSAVLTDLQGKAVWNANMGTVSGMVSKDVKLSDNANGMYILRVTVDGETAIRKLIVE